MTLIMALSNEHGSRKVSVMSIRAADVMTSHVITAAPDDTVAAVARQLAINHISGVPVCDKGGKLLGMLSESDLMRPFMSEVEARRSWWLHLLAEGTELAPNFLDYIRQDRRHAKDLMTTPVVSVSEQTSAREIGDLMIKQRIKHVPVLRDGQLVGIVTRADIIRVIASLPSAPSEQP
jgi:CBS domain-containing protein